MRAPAQSPRGRVASETRESAEAGAALLRAGGNAADAAVAAAIAETIVSPHNAGIAGFAGSMLVYQAAARRVLSFKFDTVAPRRATPHMFVGARDEHRAGALSVGVPGVLRGLEAAVLQCGRRPWAEVVAPAQRLAEEGVAIGPASAARIRDYRRQLKLHPATAAMLMPGGKPPASGDHVCFPDLARSLGLIAAQGADAFYKGDLGEQTVRFLQAQGGILERDDLASYAVDGGPPLEAVIGDRCFYASGLPGGGSTVLQCLRVLHELGLPVDGRPSTDAAYLHALIQTMLLAWRDRLTHMADPAFMRVKPESFLSDAHVAGLVQRIRADDVPDDFSVPADFTCTSHVSAVDADGNLAAVTYTHGFAFGSMVTIPGTGIILGHGMARFDGVAGRPNSVAPGKRALHNMAPLIMRAADGSLTAMGWTGGRRIPNVILQVAVNLAHFGMPLREALAEPNLHTEGAEPITAESAVPEETLDALRARGHRFTRLDHPIGFGSAVTFDPASGQADAATDPRRNGVVAAG